MVAQGHPDHREQRAGERDAGILLGRHDLVGDLAGNLNDELASNLLGELTVRRGELTVRRGEGVLHSRCST